MNEFRSITATVLISIGAFLTFAAMFSMSPAVDVTGCMFAGCAAFLGLFGILLAPRPDPQKALGPLQSAWICGACGGDGLVAEPAQGVGPFQRAAIRCLMCGMRRNVPKAAWKQIVPAQPGDPYETHTDRTQFLMTQHMRLRPAGLLVVLTNILAVGLAACLSTLAHLTSYSRDTSWIAFFLSWSIALAIVARCMPAERRPGRRCVRCAFDLCGATGGRCPECGTRFDVELVRTATQPNSDRPRIS